MSNKLHKYFKNYFFIFIFLIDLVFTKNKIMTIVTKKSVYMRYFLEKINKIIK